jgi:hypothetical protein
MMTAAISSLIRAQTFFSNSPPAPFGTIRPNVFKMPRIWLSTASEDAEQLAARAEQREQGITTTQKATREIGGRIDGRFDRFRHEAGHGFRFAAGVEFTNGDQPAVRLTKTAIAHSLN